MKYNKEIGEKICRATAKSSIGLRHICKNLGLPYSTVTDWVYDPEHELYEKYMRAKQQQLHYLADEIFEIIENSTNDYMEVVLKNGTTKIIQNKETAARTRIRLQARIAIITKLAPVLYKTKPGKITHRVIMPPPPLRNPAPEATDTIPADGHITPPSPACPKPAGEKSSVQNSTDEGSAELEESFVFPGKRFPIAVLTFAEKEKFKEAIDGSAPKYPPKRLPDGGLEWVGENGHIYASKRVSAKESSHHYRW